MMLNAQIRNPSSSEVKRESETTSEVAAQKAVEEHNEVQKSCKGILSHKHQKHQQQDTDSHNVSEMRKIETYTTASKKSEDAEKQEIGDWNTQQHARD